MFMSRTTAQKINRVVALWVMICLAGSSMPAAAQRAAPPIMPGPPGLPALPNAEMPEDAESNDQPADDSKLILLNYRDAPLDQILNFYADLTGRTMIKAPGINATITIKGQTRLTKTEVLLALESVLAMNNVVLVPMGKKFFKVVQPTQARQEGMSISNEIPEKGFAESDQLISQIINLKYLEVAEAQAVIQGFVHGYGKIQPLERTNSLLITDTAGNLQRIVEILSFIDQPTETKVETRIYELKYAEAAKIASRLNELIQDAQAKEEKPRVAVAQPATPSPPGVIRAPRAGGSSEQSTAGEAEAALAERGIVQGKVKIIADDRTNILIVISRPSNFIFFDKIVAVLDRPVEPDIIVRVLALEYAKAEEIAGILNEFIGAAKAESTSTGAAAAAPGKEGEKSNEPAAAQALRDYVAQRAEERVREAITGTEKSKIGRLSSSTRILSDKRTNSLLLMGTKGDVAALEEVIDKLDIMLAQVLIEAVILEVNLSKSLEYGVDWLQRSMTAYNEETRGPSGGITVRQPVMSYGGGWGGSGGSFLDASQITRSTELAEGALTYYATFHDLNIDSVIRMVGGSSDARILSTPVILTTDNTEAKITVGEERPVVTSTSTSTAGQQTSSYEYRNIGINLTVTPRINPARFVVMEITQTADNVGGFEVIDGNNVPIVTKRELQASVAVQNRSTIVLGGLDSTDRSNTRSKVPLLGDLPFLGVFFRADTRNNKRTELLVLLTPYVMMNPQETFGETKRLHNILKSDQLPWYRGWSQSPLSEPDSNLKDEELFETPETPMPLDEESNTTPAKVEESGWTQGTDDASFEEPAAPVVQTQPATVKAERLDAPVPLR